MQGTVQPYKLYMYNNGKQQPLKAKQYDTNSRVAAVELLGFGGPYMLPFDDAKVYLYARKADGKVVFNECEITGETTVNVPLTTQTLAVPGVQYAELYITSGDGDIKSTTFTIDVEPMIFDEEAIESADEFGVLQEQMVAIQSALGKVEKVAENEGERITEETIRKANEIARKQEEENRKQTSQAMEEATAKTVTATTGANTAREAANKAATNASTQAQRAERLATGLETYSEELGAKAEQTDLDLTNARIDNLVTAEPVDAEAADIRIGYDGTQYDSAGEAVREQVRDLHAEMDTKAAIKDVSGIAFTNLANGSLITVADSAEWTLVDLTVDGKSEQVGTTGSSKCNLEVTQVIKGITWVSSKDGVVSAVGTTDNSTTPTSRSYVYMDVRGQLVDGITYGVLSDNPKFEVRFRYNMDSIGYFAPTITYNSRNMELVQFQVVHKDAIVPNVVINTTGKVMVYDTSVQNVVWEPFTGCAPSPSPDYPHPIRSVGDSGNIDLCVVNGNLFDISGYVEPTPGTKIDNKSNTSITFTGTVGLNRYIAFKNKVWLKKDTPITMGRQFKIISGTADLVVSGIFRIENRDDNGKYTHYDLAPSETEKKIQAHNDGFYNVQLFINTTKILSTDVTIEFSEVKLEYSDVDTPYTPHQRHQISIPLSEPLHSLGNVKDVICRKDNVWGVERRVTKHILNGSEKWNKYGSSPFPDSYVYFCDITNLKIGFQTSICSHFRNVSVAWDKGDIGTYSDHNKNENKYFVTNFVDVYKWKDWLSVNNVTLFSIRENLIWEPFDEIIQTKLNSLHTYSQTTNIYTLDPLNPDLTVGYVQDPNLILEQQDEKNKAYTNSQIASVLALLPANMQAEIVSNSITNLLEEV